MNLLNQLQTVQVQTTSVCNGKCIFCPYTTSWYKDNPGTMDTGTYARIIKLLAEYNPEFMGKFCPYMCNEPMTDSRIVPFARLAVEKLHKPFLEISTNLVWADKKKINDILRVYEQNDWNGRIMVSFHGLNKKDYEHNMGLDYEDAFEKLQYLIKQTESRVQIWIHTAVGSRDGMLRLYDKDVVKKYWFDTFKEKGILTPNIVIYPLEVHNRSANVKLESWGFDKTVRKLGPKHPPFDCPRFYRHLHVIYTGEVVLCCNDYGHESVVGDLKTQTLEEYFNSDKFKTARAMGRGKIESPDDFLCKRCQWPGA